MALVEGSRPKSTDTMRVEEGEGQQKKVKLFTEPGFTEPIITLLKRILSCWECEDKTQVA